MGNVLLARILEYFNGTLFLDDNYRFCVFFIENYIDFYKMTLEEVVEKSKISKEAILNFLSHLGFDDYASFQDKLYADVILRQDQIRSRMLGLKMDDLFKQVHLCDDKEKFIEGSEGGAQPNISKTKIINTPFPLPPTQEQNRIVAKLDEIMAICDQMESILNENSEVNIALKVAE